MQKVGRAAGTLLAKAVARSSPDAAAPAVSCASSAALAPAAAAAWAPRETQQQQLQQHQQHHQQSQQQPSGRWLRRGPARAFGSKAADERTRWEWMKSQGHKINPCNSQLHPAAEAGMALEGEELAVQDAYTPSSTCWGCGPSAENGLKLQSFRVRNGLEARIVIPEKYCAFPGIVNGGIISTLMDCHGNWTAAIALMDRSCLPAPPLTLTASILVSFKAPAPPGVPLVVRSSVVEIKEGSQPGVGKASVEVDVSVLQAAPEGGGAEQLLASATGIFKKLGALRAL